MRSDWRAGERRPRKVGGRSPTYVADAASSVNRVVLLLLRLFFYFYFFFLVALSSRTLPHTSQPDLNQFPGRI